MYNKDYIEYQVTDCKHKIKLEKNVIENFINLYNTYRNINIDEIPTDQKYEIIKLFEKCSYIENGIAEHKFDIYKLREHSPNLTPFNEIKFYNVLTGKTFTKKSVYLGPIYIQDTYDDRYPDYLYSELGVRKIDILCDENFNDTKTYTTNQILELFADKEIIILDLHFQYSKKTFNSFDCREIISYDNILQVDIDIGDYLAKKGTNVKYLSKHDCNQITDLFFPNLYNFDYLNDFQFKIINKYEQVYPNYLNVCIQEILKMIPNEIKLRREKIDKLFSETKENIANFVEECKSYFKKEIKKQEKLKDKALKDKVLNEKLSDIEELQM